VLVCGLDLVELFEFMVVEVDRWEVFGQENINFLLYFFYALGRFWQVEHDFVSDVEFAEGGLHLFLLDFCEGS
jgi:hypothetical protein